MVMPPLQGSYGFINGCVSRAVSTQASSKRSSLLSWRSNTQFGYPYTAEEESVEVAELWAKLFRLACI